MPELFKKTSLAGVLIITIQRYQDNRGFFSEMFNKSKINQFKNLEFVQDNYSFSKTKYTFRGLHFQTSPFAQDKLISVLKGSILDIVVDLRTSSKTFGKYETFEISEDSSTQIFIPKGLAHGFLTLTENTEVFYKVTNYYSKQHDSGINIFDEQLNIKLPADKNKIILSDKDKRNQFFDKKYTYFA